MGALLLLLFKLFLLLIAQMSNKVDFLKMGRVVARLGGGRSAARRHSRRKRRLGLW